MFHTNFSVGMDHTDLADAVEKNISSKMHKYVTSSLIRQLSDLNLILFGRCESLWKDKSNFLSYHNILTGDATRE